MSQQNQPCRVLIPDISIILIYHYPDIYQLSLLFSPLLQGTKEMALLRLQQFFPSSQMKCCQPTSAYISQLTACNHWLMTFDIITCNRIWKIRVYLYFYLSHMCTALALLNTMVFFLWFRKKPEVKYYRELLENIGVSCD